MSRICYQLMESLGFDQPLLDRVTGFYASSNDAFAREHWGVAWDGLFPAIAVSQFVYSGPESELEKREMHRLMAVSYTHLTLPTKRIV